MHKPEIKKTVERLQLKHHYYQIVSGMFVCDKTGAADGRLPGSPKKLVTRSKALLVLL